MPNAVTLTDKRAKEFFASALKLLASKDYKGAITDFTMSIGCQPSPEAYLELAKIHFSADDLESTQRYMGRAKSLLAEQPDLTRQWQEIEAQLKPKLDKQAAEREKIITSRNVPAILKMLGLSNRLRKLTGAQMPSIRIKFATGKSKPTDSRVGGDPAAPDGFKWPVSKEGEPLAFLCQINLEQIASFEAAKHLPKKGLLSFFCLRYADDPCTPDVYKVTYFADPENLQKQESPREVDPPIREKPLQLTEELSFPDELLDEKGYEEFLEIWYGKAPFHRLLGNPQTIQGDLKGYLPRRKGTTWQLLLQIDSEDDLQWGDGGRIYFCIDQVSLEQGEFSNAIAVVQAY